MQFTASAELHDKLQRLAALMPGADLASMIEASVTEKTRTEKLERLEAKRLGKVKNPRKNLVDADTSPGARAIPAPVKRFVWARDQAQCTFESSEGRRCSERLGLQFHHHDPYGLGGDRSAKKCQTSMSSAQSLHGGDGTTAKTRWSGTDVPPTGSVNRSRRFHSFRTEFKNHRPFVTSDRLL